MKKIERFIDSILNSYSSTLFSSERFVGFFLLLITFLNPYTGLSGLVGCIFSNLLASAIGVYEERIQKGLYGFNGLLVGLSFSLYHDMNINLFMLLIGALVLLLFVTLALEHILGYFLGLPVLSLPFVIVSILVYFSLYNYTGFTLKTPYDFSLNKFFPQLPHSIEFYFKSLGGIFFQNSPFAGLGISILLLLSSRITFILSILGFLVGMKFHLWMGGSEADLTSGGVGFNFILTAIAVGGYFLVPGKGSFSLGILATICSVIISSFAKVFLVQFNIPVLALPFTTVSLLFLYVARLLHNPNFALIDFPPGTPETNLDYYKTRKERFGLHGQYIRLPFSGKWIVSQGYDGEFTHKDKWKESLDFMALDQNNKNRKNLTEAVEDFYTYGLPVLAPASGKVIRVISHVEDNPLYQVETHDNWGNLVLIEHNVFLYSQVSHLQKNSILVKEGDYVTVGTKLGLAGNSGRSPLPHIHLHFQATPEIGSSTIPITFTQYLEESEEKSVVRFTSIPKEKAIISNLNSDFNLKSFYTIAPSLVYPIQVDRNNKLTYENWTAKLDFWGNRYLEDEKNNQLYFYIAQDYFSCIDYLGKKDSALFYFYIASYRVPFVSGISTWEDRISYKYFSKPLIRFIKDLIQPFSNRVSFEWHGKINQNENGLEIESRIGKENQSTRYEIKHKITGNLPGEILIKKNGDEVIIRRKQD
ncbi:MAG: urea transporter [Leptospiraceae bacterium]|nr:urea transporter [Leptospiraceae bacterium]